MEFLPALITVIVALIIFWVVRWQRGAFNYKCPQCGYEFQITSGSAFLSPHALNRKYLKCPRCSKWGWATLVRKRNLY